VRFQLLAFFFFVYFILTILSYTIEGQYYGSSDVTLAEQLLGYNVAQMQGPGILTIPKVGASLITHAIPKTVMWDYAFFEGSWQLVRYFFLVVFSGPLIIVVGYESIIALQGVFSRFL